MIIGRSELDPWSAELLDLLCNALSILSHNELYGPVEACLRRLERLAAGDDRRGLPVKMLICALRADVNLRKGAYDEAVEACTKGIQMSPPASQEHYFFSSRLIHVLLNRGDQQSALDAMTTALQDAITRNVPKTFLDILLKTAKRVDVPLAPGHERLRGALREFAIAKCGLTQEVFDEAGEAGLVRVIEAMGY